MGIEGVEGIELYTSGCQHKKEKPKTNLFSLFLQTDGIAGAAVFCDSASSSIDVKIYDNIDKVL